MPRRGGHRRSSSSSNREVTIAEHSGRLSHGIRACQFAIQTVQEGGGRNRRRDSRTTRPAQRVHDKIVYSCEVDQIEIGKAASDPRMNPG